MGNVLVSETEARGTAGSNRQDLNSCHLPLSAVLHLGSILKQALSSWWQDGCHRSRLPLSSNQFQFFPTVPPKILELSLIDSYLSWATCHLRAKHGFSGLSVLHGM